MAEIERRELIWLSPRPGVAYPGVAYPGVVLWRRWGIVKVLCWDRTRQWTSILLWPSEERLLSRISGKGVVRLVT